MSSYTSSPRPDNDDDLDNDDIYSTDEDGNDSDEGYENGTFDCQ